MTKKSITTLTKQWSDLKKEIETLVKKGQTSAKDTQKRIDAFLKSAEKDFNGIMDKDLPKFVSKIKREKATLEKRVEKLVNEEIRRAKKFLGEHKKELDKLQKSIESFLPKSVQEKVVAKVSKVSKKVRPLTQSKKKVAKKTAKKAPRKITKKVAKKTAKKAPKKIVRKPTKQAPPKSPKGKAGTNPLGKTQRKGQRNK